jgi:hypothetical protein
MRHCHSLTRAGLAASFALLLGSCTLDVPDAFEATEGSEPIGTTVEADNRDLPAVALPYETEIHFTHDLYSRRFVIHPPLHASITVTVTANWNYPGACRAPLQLTMMHAESRTPVTVDAAKLFRTDGKKDPKSWQNLQPGEYYLQLEVPGSDVQRCKIDGSLTIRPT